MMMNGRIEADMGELNLDEELKALNNSIDEHLLDFRHHKYYHSETHIYLFNLEGYNQLIVKQNQIRFASNDYQEKVNMQSEYRKILNAKRLKLRRLLRNLENGTLEVKYNTEINKNVDFLKKLITDSYRYNEDVSQYEKVVSFIKTKLRGRIYEVNHDIYRLRKYPNEYINTLSTFIAPNNPTKFDRDIIFYKDVFICNKESHHMGVYYNENTLEETKRAILNILAYLSAEPFFYFTKNFTFNRKIDDLYKQFDLMDMIRLRKKDYFSSQVDEPFHIESPILKTKNGFNFIEVKDVQHEMIFELYHASLKQFESLPRCVFLYRAFEYGNNYYFNPIYQPSNAAPENALNQLFNLAMNHTYMPLYYADFGSYLSEDRKTVISKRKFAYRNFILKLKDEARTIETEWGQHPHVSNMTVGAIIYNTGRNASAHGGAGQHNARYDYSRNYKHINDVNIMLELIVRYLIEKMNPHIANLVERRKKYYIQYYRYEKVFEQES